jgi:hypothetical protein
MRATALDNLLRPNRVYRVVALFFLVFTFIDLACPWLCQEDVAGFPKIVQTQVAAGADTHPALSDSERQDDNKSKPENLEEDCFCCCTHLQPSYGPGTPAVNVMRAAYLRPLTNLPTAPPTGTDHPPRSASC